jgi:hypothetical protein
VARERHLRHGSHETAVRTIVIGQQLAFAVQALDHVEEVLEVFRVVDVGALSPTCCVTCARMLPPMRFLARPRSIAISTLSQVRAKLRRQRAVHVVHRRECGDDQRYRRYHFLVAIGIGPRCASTANPCQPGC